MPSAPRARWAITCARLHPAHLVGLESSSSARLVTVAITMFDSRCIRPMSLARLSGVLTTLVTRSVCSACARPVQGSDAQASPLPRNSVVVASLHDDELLAAELVD